VGDEPVYTSLERFLPAPPASWVDAQTRESGVRGPTPSSARETLRTAGPTSHGARQPTGALSGVTVYMSAGHGWTAGSSNWALQRPVLLEMAEDYGNIDQLNYFAHYVFNAGGTVVPFRPVSWQEIEIVLDNDDPAVTYTGSWMNAFGAKAYDPGGSGSGVRYRTHPSDVVETATARYTPAIPVADFYPVFAFTPAGADHTLQTYRVAHSGGITEVVVDHREVGFGWVWLGEYYFEAGSAGYVEITNVSSEAGLVIADAIRFGGGMGDIVRPGPGKVSGYPRDEEAQRYWAHSELGNNGVGFDSYIWDNPGVNDGSDNVRVGAHWAREMNQVPAGGVQVDRWKRIHLEFHTNASSGAARGQLTLITDLGPTSYQTEYAEILSDEVDHDLLIIDDTFEHTWVDRSFPTYTGSYGAICTPANGDEFDATIVELAFHDNPQDAELLRDCRVRQAMARASLHGIIRFLNTLPGSQVPLAFLPDTPRFVRATDLGNGEVQLAWEPPLADDARGDPATGYVVYTSTNGYGFGNPVDVGNVTSTVLTGLTVGQPVYFRVAATNAGGESMPTEVVSVCPRDPQQQERILVVNGFDRLRRQINALQVFTQPPNYAGDSIERQIWRRSNAFDYVVQHGEALAANGWGYESCSNETVEFSYVQLGDYDAVVWILGTESTEDATFTSNEQIKVEDYLLGGGGLFVSGSEIAYDLIASQNGESFANDVLGIDYGGDDAGTDDVTGAGGGIFADIGPFDFDLANGAAYDVRSPDELLAGSDAQPCLDYVGGTSGVAGVQYFGCAYNTVVLGFPFETITDAGVRDAIMQRAVVFLLSAPGPQPFDYERDCDVDLDDFVYFRWCFLGPDVNYTSGHVCLDVEGVDDSDIDLHDFSVFQAAFNGPAQ
jgi:hypothetical protein